MEYGQGGPLWAGESCTDTWRKGEESECCSRNGESGLNSMNKPEELEGWQKGA